MSAELVGTLVGRPAESHTNSSERDLEFFRGVPQVEIQHKGYTVRVPTFYYDATHFYVAMLAPLNRLAELLPSPGLQPMRASPRHGLLHLGVFEYRDSDVGPYNEVSITVAATPEISVPMGIGLLRSMKDGPTGYIWQLPVTTDIACVLGVELFGFPKFLGEIDIGVEGDWGHCRLSENGELIFDLTVKLPTPRPDDRYHYHTLSQQHGRIVRADVNVNLRERGVARLRTSARLIFGDHPLGRILDNLGIGRVLEVGYMPAMQSILTAPTEGYPA